MIHPSTAATHVFLYLLSSQHQALCRIVRPLFWKLCPTPSNLNKDSFLITQKQFMEYQCLAIACVVCFLKLSGLHRRWVHLGPSRFNLSPQLWHLDSDPSSPFSLCLCPFCSSVPPLKSTPTNYTPPWKNIIWRRFKFHEVMRHNRQILCGMREACSSVAWIPC